jgi:transcriptional regulator with XRE-family HTH domain
MNESAMLGNNLKRIREAKNMSQGDIMRSLGCSRSYISNIENGKTNPTLSTIAKLAKAVGVPLNKLLQ